MIVTGIRRIVLDVEEILVDCATDAGLLVTMHHDRDTLSSELVDAEREFVAVYNAHMRVAVNGGIETIHDAITGEERPMRADEQGFVKYMANKLNETAEEAVPEPNTGPVTVTFRGWLSELADDYGGELLVLADHRVPSYQAGIDDEPILADIIENGTDDLGCNWTVRYWTADREMSGEELLEGFLFRLYAGKGDAAYYEGSEGYSEWTPGSLSHESFRIGGHDLLEELRTHVGKFLHLEITCTP